VTSFECIHVRDCCEELFLTFLYSFKSMFSRDGTSNKGGEESFFMLQAIQQQFECMNVVFNEIRDRMDRQDAIIATSSPIPSMLQDRFSLGKMVSSF
jgi:hypothetical protein